MSSLASSPTVASNDIGLTAGIGVPSQREFGLNLLVWNPIVNFGGGMRLLAQLINALAEQPNLRRITVAVEGAHLRDLLSESPKIEFVDLTPPRPFASPYLFGLPHTILFKMQLLGAVRLDRASWWARSFSRLSRQCDLVYCSWPHRVPVPQTTKPIVCTFQDATLLEFPEISGARETQVEWELSERWLRSSKVVVSSHAMAEKLQALFGYTTSTIIHHAISPAGVPATSKASYNMPPLPERYIVYPGYFVAHKNHYNLLVAYSRFSRRHELPLVFFGSRTELLGRARYQAGHDYTTIRLNGLVRRLQLQAGRDFYALGYVPDEFVPTLIRNSAALVMPSLAEGGGSFPVEEALSLGVPVACSSIPVMREHLAQRSAKIAWFDPESSDSILDALEELFVNYDTYQASARAAQNDPRPSWNEVASNYAELFAATLAQAHQR